MEDFIHKLNLIPPQADRLLRQIRQLDQQVQAIHLQILPARQQILQKLTQKQTGLYKQMLIKEHKAVAKMESEMEAKTNQKIAIAEKLYNLIHEPTERLDKEMHQRGLDRVMEESRKKKIKKVVKPIVGELHEDPNEPKYCYCGKPSFGVMVQCENSLCEGQWFHIACIDQKKLPQKWYCRNCRGDAVKLNRKK